jgi:hypothetical protein
VLYRGFGAGSARARRAAGDILAILGARSTPDVCYLRPVRWIVLAAVACSAPAKPERERPSGLPSDDRALQLERADRAPPAIATGEAAADYELAPGAQLHVLAASTSGQLAISADSRWVVYGDGRGLHSVRVDGLVDRVLAAGAASPFRLTGDSKHVVYGRRLARVPVGGGQALAIAPGLEVAELGNFVVSPDARWVAFTEASGDLAIASLADGTARRLKVPRPLDARFHF